MSFKQINKSDIDFYVSVLKFLEEDTKKKLISVKAFKELDSAPELPEPIVDTIKGLLRSFKEDVEATLKDRCILLMAKLYLFEENKSGEFEQEITKQDLELLSEAIDKWEEVPAYLNGFIEFYHHLKEESPEKLEGLPPQLLSLVEHMDESISNNKEERNRKATFGKAKLILLRQKKEADAFLEGL